MMTQVWVKGYVVGYDKVERGTAGQVEVLWTVKVKDQKSAHNGQKFEVHSTVGPTLTKPSVDVSFRVEPIQVGQEQVLKAVDVRLSTTTQVEPKRESNLPRKDSETFNLAVVETSSGERYVIVTGFQTRAEAEDWFESESGGEERVVDFLQFDIYEVQNEDDSEEIPGAFEVIKALSVVENSRQAIEKLLTALYNLSRKPQK